MEEKRVKKEEVLKPRRTRIIESREFKLGFTIFIAGALLILFYQIVGHYAGFKALILKVGGIISPFIYGFVLAYLLSPVYNFVVRKLYPIFSKGDKIKNKSALTIARVIASVVSILLLIGVVGGMVALVVPQLFDSVSRISATLPNAFNRFITWVERYTANMNNQEIAGQIHEAVDSVRENVVTWVQNRLLPGVGNLVQRVSTGVLLTLRRMLNMLLGLVACVYFLNGKEMFRAQAHKTVRAIASPKVSAELDEFVSFTNKTFGGFINGKIIDSIIIGIICFIVMTLFNWPYAILVSTIIGVTNIIPFFGPFIGAVPSALILATVEPWTAFWFLVMIAILQQLDGNVIGPAILGQSTGLSSFWVMFSIVVAGGLFGFAGMLLGVPVFAIIYYYFSKAINSRLEKKGMDVLTIDYEDFGQYKIDKDELLNDKDDTVNDINDTANDNNDTANNDTVNGEDN